MKHRRFHPYDRGVGRLTRIREIGVHALLGGVWVSGSLWLIVRYFFRPSTEFGELPNSAEAWWMRAHAAFAFGVIWLAGFLWAVHVRPAWRSRRRISGIILGVSLIILIASGYLLYYVGDDALRSTISVVHWVIGLGLIVPWLLHALTRVRSRKTE